MKTEKEQQRETWRKASLKYYYKNKKDCLERVKKYRNREKDNERNRLKFNKLYKEDEEFKRKKLLRRKHQYHVKKKVCTECGSKNNLEIHHLDYKTIDLFQILCRRCHREIHNE